MNSPKISFNKNSQAWTFIYFSEAFEFLNNKAISRCDLNYQEGSIKCIHYGDILTKFPQILDSSSPLLPYVNNDVDVENVSTLKTGDIVIADTAEDYAVGKSIEVSITDDSKVIAGLHTMSCRPKKNFAFGFLGYYINSTAYHGQLRRLVTGTKVYAINKSEIRKTNLHFPCVEEQQKIAAFFTALDEKISIATKKLIQFKKLKKEIARSLFEDCAAEDFKKIGDFARTFAGATPSTSHKEYWENGTIPWMSSGEINNRYIHSVEKRITALGFDKTSTKWVKKGSTLVALAGQGKTRGKVAFTEMELCTNQSLAAIECDREEVNDKYLFFFLETQYENLRAQSTGDGGRGGLNLFIINNFEVPIFPLHEQVRIVSILELIDKKVELAENKLLVLEQVKRAFMQQMFV